MKKTNSFMNKILAGFLSLAMVITGALSLGTMKKHTASADMQTFVSLMLDSMMDAVGNSKACLIVDNQLIPNASNGTRFNNLEDESRGFIDAIAERLGISATASGFQSVNLYVFAQLSGNNNRYVNLMNGAVGSFDTLVRNGVENIGGSSCDFSMTDTSFFGAMGWTTNQEIIDYFLAFQSELGILGFPVFAYEKIGIDEEDSGPNIDPINQNGLHVKYYIDDNDYFIDCVV